MKLKEIADRINEHLKRFESDKEINKPSAVSGLPPYYYSFARVAGRYVFVRYISYQCGSHLTKNEAIDYLNWLDAGSVGKHFALFGHKFARSR